MRDSDVEAVLDTLRSGWLTMGPRIQAFEEQFAAHVGATHAVAVSSGTAALHLAIRASTSGGRDSPSPLIRASTSGGRDSPSPLGEETGEKGVRSDSPLRWAVPVLGGDAAAAAVAAAGHEVVLWDPPEPAPEVDAAVVVHPFGMRAPAHDLAVPFVEDCRSALGLGVGRAGAAACWSFADGRPLAMGEGGMVTTEDDAFAARVRLLRAHAMTSGTWDRHRGHSATYDVVDVGFNFRLDEPRAALGSAQLAHLTEQRETVEAVVVHDVEAAVRRLRAAGIDAEPVTPLGPTRHPVKLVRLAPGARRDAVATALRA